MSDTPPPVSHGDPGATVPVGGAAWGPTRSLADEPTVAEPRPAPTSAAAPSAWSQPPAAAPAPSAWTQPATTHPTPPAGLGFPNAPTPRPRRTERMWLIGSGVVVVVALIVTIVLVTTGGSGGSLAVAPGAPTTTKPAGPVFTHVPASCELISASTISTYAAGATCRPALTDKDDLPGMIIRQPNWVTQSGTDANSYNYVNIQVHLTVGATAADNYTMATQSITDVMTNFDDITDQHAITGIGSKAVYAYGHAKNGLTSGDADIVVLDGNAELDISFSGMLDNTVGNNTPVSDSDAETAEKALAKDILSHLS